MYKVDPKAGDVEAAFRAIAKDQLDEALADFGEDEDGRSVIHELRRRCKKLRGLLRLVRPAFPDYARENAAIRDAAALLSHLRDAEVLKDSVVALGKEKPSAALQRVAARLGAAATGPEAGDRLEKFRAQLGAVRERAAHWSLTRSGPNAVLPGFVDLHRMARRDLAEAAETRDPVALHDWRKANKYHGFHLDLLKRLAPDVFGAEVGLVDRLSEILGEHHDLVVLDHAVAADPARFGDEADVAALSAAAEARRSALESDAFALGRQIYAERPSAVRERIGAYWKAAQ